MDLGQTIKTNRKNKGWTLRDLSLATGLSTAQLSKLENNKSNPSIDSLRRLSKAFDLPISALTLTETRQQLSPVLNGEGFIVRWCKRGDEYVTVRYLIQDRNAQLQPIILTIPSGMDTGKSESHKGDEFFYVLRGTIRFFYNDESFDLNVGDFLYYNGLFSHHWQNVSDEEAEIMTCNTPPVM